MSAGTGLSKISFGNNIPGWATAVSKSPAFIILQVQRLADTLAARRACQTLLVCKTVLAS